MKHMSGLLYRQCIILTTTILLKFRFFLPTPCFLFTEFKFSVLTSCSYTVNLDFNCVTKYHKRRPKRIRGLPNKTQAVTRRKNFLPILGESKMENAKKKFHTLTIQTYLQGKWGMKMHF